MVYYLLVISMNQDYILIIGLCGGSIFLKTDHFHHREETITIDDVTVEPGGKGYNQAVTIKKMGQNVHFIGCIGNDSYGDLCKKYLQDLNIDFTFFNKPTPSTFAYILTDKCGNNQVSVYPGASLLLDEKMIKDCEDLIKGASIVLLTYEVSMDVLNYVVSTCNKYNCMLIINPAPYKNYTKSMLNQANVVTPNLYEAFKMFDIDDFSMEKLIQAVKKYEHNIIVTLGKDGVLFKENNTFLHLPPFELNEVVDTTGAGDVFNGILASFLLKNANLLSSCVYAILGSGRSITKPHVMSSIPELDALDDLIYVEDNQYPKTYFDSFRRTSRCFLINEKNEFGMLLIKGCDEFGERNHLESVGGGVQDGESDEEAIRREVLEETGFTVQSLESIGYLVHEYNSIRRLNYAHYFKAFVDTSCKQSLNLTAEESKLFKGLRWGKLSDLIEILKQANSKCDELIHNRELKGVELLNRYERRKNN